MLQGKVAVVYGGGGAIGGAAARAFARHGARLFLAGRTRAGLETVAADLGGDVDLAQVDAMDPDQVGRHVEHVLARAGRIDIVLNAIGFHHVQGPPLAELSLDDFMFPLTGSMRANFNIARAVAPAMTRRGAGVILTLSTPGARITGSGFLGFGVTCGAVETFSRLLAGELGASGVRVVCLRPDAIAEAVPTSHAAGVFADFARRAGVTVEAMLEQRARQVSLLGRSPRLAEVAEAAAFAASDHAGAMTGAVVNLTCGSVVD